MDKKDFNSEDIKKLRSLISKTRQANLKKALVDLKAGKSLTNAQVKALQVFDEELKEAESQRSEDGSQRSEESQSFITLRHVLAYLIKHGYETSQTSLYRHGKQSKIRPAPDGTYDLKSVKTYASTFLKKVATGLTEKTDNLQREHAKEKLLNLQIKNKQDALKLAIKEGHYILRTLCHRELAARGVAIDHDCRFSIQADAAVRVEMVGGNMSKVQDLIRFDMQRHDERMNRFATLKEFHVIYEPKEQNDE